jgi:hypothetical protein
VTSSAPACPSDTVTAEMDVWFALGRHVGWASLAGLISGILVGGVLGRIAMRVRGFAAGPSMVGVHTSNGNRVGDITVAGTLALVLSVGVASGLAGGVVYAALEPWLRRLRPWHGLAYGGVLLAVFGFTVLDPSNFDFTRFGPPALNVAMFAALFVIFGVSTAWSFDRLRTLATKTGTTARVVEVLAWLALGPAMLVAVLLVIGGLTQVADPLFALVCISALAVASIVHWRRLPPLVGYASLVGALVLGAARTVGGLPQLVAGF